MAKQARHLGMAIERPAAKVYEFARRPENLVLWASGLGSIRRERGRWVAENPSGRLRLRFARRNAWGVLDHWVQLENGTEIYIPLRVIDTGNSCELVFTLLRQPDMSDAQFETDADWIMRDLTRLKQLLETSA
jgi:hypothetical protein